MRKFRLLNREGYSDEYVTGCVYAENYKASVGMHEIKNLVEMFPKDWEEEFFDENDPLVANLMGKSVTFG